MQVQEKPLTRAGTTTLQQDKQVYCFNLDHFSPQSGFLVRYYRHQEEKIWVILGIKWVIGLIRGIRTEMRRSAMRPL